MDNSIYEQVNSIAASNELIGKAVKAQSLSVLRQKLIDARQVTSDKVLKTMIDYDLTIIEDCYNVDMYKFQFKGLMDILQKDIHNIERASLL